jgi:hypothetical protein
MYEGKNEVRPRVLTCVTPLTAQGGANCFERYGRLRVSAVVLRCFGRLPALSVKLSAHPQSGELLDARATRDEDGFPCNPPGIIGR